jgi:hypothetical protein
MVSSKADKIIYIAAQLLINKLYLVIKITDYVYKEIVPCYFSVNRYSIN